MCVCWNRDGREKICNYPFSVASVPIIWLGLEDFMLMFSHPVMSNSLQLQITALQNSLSLTISWSLPKFMFIVLVMWSSHIILWFPLCLPSIFTSICVFQRVGSSHQVAKVLELVLASVLPVNVQGWFPLGLTALISLQFKGLSRVFSSTTIQRHSFFSIQLSLWSNSYICPWPLEKPQLWLYRPLWAKCCLCFLICCLGLS